MKVSLNELVQLLADRVGHTFSVPIQEELKVILNYKRADWVQKILDKHPEQRKFFLKDFSVSLEEVEKAECPVDTGCTVLRTTKKIPVPVRTSYGLFDYVGDPDKLDGYTYTTPDQLYWMLKHGSKFTKNRPRYFYVNEYVYIYNEDALENVGIRGVFPDQRQLNEFKCAGEPCYTDDDQYDIPGDIINTMMQDVIKNELRLFTTIGNEEVTLKDETQTQTQ